MKHTCEVCGTDKSVHYYEYEEDGQTIRVYLCEKCADKQLDE